MDDGCMDGLMDGGKKSKENAWIRAWIQSFKRLKLQLSASAAHFSQDAADSGSTSGTVLVQEQPAQLSQLWSL